MKIVIVDYGMGNIKSITSTLLFIGVDEVVLSSDYEKLRSADKLILPGVGSFGKAMAQIKSKQLDVYLKDLVVENKKPLLGICLGMQLLGMSSTEDGENQGLGFINGSVIKFDNSNLKVPHVGFNQLKVNREGKLYDGLADDPDFYFTHSYKMISSASIKQSMCDYGGEFISGFEVGNIAGVQFHPELSQNNGIKLFKNFITNY
ncbi:glutamine amidotransferase [Daejeonella rubra]|uniref:Imidazole glycerol phosphate synthase subunit HisH n=1 Tax=Daejeonella rubra TaxID=990371 RepID=A0A1G9WV84_9SPHI|nr:imidazole glycerol phosphate synthase subunit HisH [Daejeonella rubra]SDM88023.1 glutamine amidotransferase [Daejeonella rubra]